MADMNVVVRPLKQKDAGRGIAAFDRQVVDALGLEGGDYAALKSTRDKRTLVRVWPGYPEDDGTGIVRVDDRIRSQLGADVDDTVTVEAADVKPAASVTLAPPEDVTLAEHGRAILADRLSGSPVSENSTVTVEGSVGVADIDHSLPLFVVSSDPDGDVVITNDTDVRISNHSAAHWEQLRTGSVLTRYTMRAAQLLSSSHPTSRVATGLGLVVLLSLAVLGLSFALARATGTPVRVWIQTIGTITIVALSGLTLWYQSTK